MRSYEPVCAPYRFKLKTPAGRERYATRVAGIPEGSFSKRLIDRLVHRCLQQTSQTSAALPHKVRRCRFARNQGGHRMSCAFAPCICILSVAYTARIAH